MTKLRGIVFTALTALALACGGTVDEEAIDVGGSDYGDDVEGVALDALTAVAGGKAKVIAKSGLNLRKQPTTSSSVLVAMPYGSTVDVLQKQGSWFSVKFEGRLGWAFGAYLEGLGGSGGSSGGGSEGSSGGGSGQDAVDEMIARARSGLGFSYHWGGGCWDPGSSSTGACYGSCPGCKHEGKWGADCSGYVSKIWQVPSEEEVTECGHPYSTSDFYSARTHWTAVPRSSAKVGDAFVRKGHIFLYNGGDAWGSMRAYEAKGCSYGIVYNSRTADSSYIVIRRR